MTTNVTKPDLVRAIAESHGLSQAKAGEILTTLLDEVVAAARAGKTVNISGFGKFAMKTRAARTGRNPATGEPVEIAASTSLHFKPSKAAKG